MGTTPVRSDIAAITGIDAFGFQRERWLMANAVVEWMPTIKGRNGRIQGTPESCGKRIAGIYRVSEQLGLPTVSKGLVYQTVKAEMRQCALKHGPEWLQSNRKDPLPFTLIHDPVLLCCCDMCTKFFHSMQSLHADSTVIKDRYYWIFLEYVL